MSDLLIDVNGETVLLDSCGAAFLPAQSTLVFADLHFEKGSSYARGRQYLPPYDTINTLLRMARAVARHKPARVIALGDSFHDREAGDRMGPEERGLLDSLSRSARFTWIAGNHDPNPPDWLAGDVTTCVRAGGLVFRHEPVAAFEAGEVAGHLHPCASVSKWGRSVRRRCFVSDGLRMILPSFGAYTGGLDVGDTAIAALFAGPFHAYMLGQTRVYAIPRRLAV
ncbi:MAG: ligase-associated DNA damage response endonuclease PdeM [Alphaproteobacteria bacterium]|nr:ligase-associated DNA damage response endonuclease PdeM [Alphaproteobacteria bacterium]